LTRFLALLALVLSLPALAQQGPPANPDLDQFKKAWQAAGSGNRALFNQIMAGMADYVLYPYLQYEDFRFRRATADPAEMAAFIDTHSDWAFTPGLRRAWLRTLGQKKQWGDLLRYGTGEQDDTVVRCYLAQARIQRGDTSDLLSLAQSLWVVGRSQPEACDPVFDWLREAKGITPELAWQRISRAMSARNPRLTRYLERYIPAAERKWVKRWQQQDLKGYTRLDQARHWPVQDKAREIAQFGLNYLARHDADKAWSLFEVLDGKMHWDTDQRDRILREIAMWSAIDFVPDALARLHAVPRAGRDDTLLQWWARYGMATDHWGEAADAIAAMSEEVKSSDRWRYWAARARLKLGDTSSAMQMLDGLSRETSYYGFLAADYLGHAYSICPAEPAVSTRKLSRFSDRPAFQRAAELEKAGLKNWSRREWNLALATLSQEELRLAAALAIEKDWPDLAVLALAKSGDRNWYAWRFPLDFASEVRKQARKRGLDAAWVLGLVRSESAMATDAVSHADARGLMQVTPGTAARVARRHGYTYRGRKQLFRVEDNIVFGTTFLRELMDRYNNNPVLALGAYNAGPAAVNRWLDALPIGEPAIWIENLPYAETRDYIPRVLAFATIYDWRLQQPVKRITARMTAPDSGNIGTGSGTSPPVDVSCPNPMVAPQSGR